MPATQKPGYPDSPINDETIPAIPKPRSGRIDPAATAGNRNSLGAESIRDGRPATDDNTVEAIDEEDPAIRPVPNR